MLRLIKEYNLPIIIICAFTRVLKFLRLPLYGYTTFKHRIVRRYLWKRYSGTVDYSQIEKGETSPFIFSFWWQGEDSAPDVVKMCLDSIRRNSADRRFVLITKDNYREWTTIPEEITDKMLNGKISLTHYSDIVRFNLLYEHGGVWLDATCYLAAQIPEDRYEYPFFTNKGAFSASLKFKWTSFYMICSRHSVIAKNMLNFYYSYWKEHNVILTYLILDCWMGNLYRYTQISQIIDNLPHEGTEIFDNIMFKSCSEENFSKLGNYYLYKLSYKYQYPMTVDGEKSIFGALFSSWMKTQKKC